MSRHSAPATLRTRLIYAATFLAATFMPTIASAASEADHISSADLARIAVDTFHTVTSSPNPDLLQEVMGHIEESRINLDDPETVQVLAEAGEKALKELPLTFEGQAVVIPVIDNETELERVAVITHAVVTSKLGKAINRTDPVYFEKLQQAHKAILIAVAKTMAQLLNEKWRGMASFVTDDVDNDVQMTHSNPTAPLTIYIGRSAEQGEQIVDPVIENGVAHVTFAFDVGQSIDLKEAMQRISAASHAPIQHPRPAPEHFNFQSPPISFSQDSSEHVIGGWTTLESVECVLNEIGAIQVSYRIPFSGPFSRLTKLSEHLSGNEVLLADAREVVQKLVHELGDAVAKPLIADTNEDYIIFQISNLASNVSVAAFLDDNKTLVTQVLGADPKRNSDQEVQEAFNGYVSYSKDDFTVIDWASALLVNTDGTDGEDVLAVLKFATVQLLELRLLDARLDAAIDELYRNLSRPNGKASRSSEAGGDALTKISHLSLESAMMYENIINSLKLIGDQYLARLYEKAATRFHLDVWGKSIQKKLDGLESTYKKMEKALETNQSMRSERSIILMIGVEIVIGVAEIVLGILEIMILKGQIKL